MALDRAEQILRAQPGSAFTHPGATIFEDQAGHFWGILETRDYMRARYGVVESVLKINTLPAVQTAFDHIMDMLRLCRSDNMGVRYQAPALFLRLGKDQECYDFIKWWATSDPDGTYDWGNMDLPYCNIKNADVFENVDPFVKRFASLSHAIALLLIKIRLLLDLKALQNSSLLKKKLPPELIDNIRVHIPASTIIIGNKDIIESKDQTPLIEKLELQVVDLYTFVDTTNPYFFESLLQPEDDLKARPEYHSSGSVQEMQLYLQHNYASWAETLGAIEMIQEMSDYISTNLSCDDRNCFLSRT
jgi:hypothetical protein